MKHITTLLIISLISFSFSFGQSNRWKRMRYEVFGGLGATNFLGELGGSDESGSNFIKDFEISQTRFGGTLGARYWIRQKLAVQTAFSLGYVRGDDKKTDNIYRQNRNLNFRSIIIEWQARLEYNILAPKKGHRYNLRKVRGRPGNNVTFDIFAGVGVFYFNPQGYSEQYGWVNLRPLGTEGQNYLETRDPYSRFSACIPIGFQVKYIVNRKWSIGLEFGTRYTFTDYIDDVSTTYGDPDRIRDSYSGNGEVAEYYADPSISRNIDGNPSYTAANEQRGNSFNNDVYMFMFVTVNYKLRTGRNGLPRFK